LHAHYQLQDRGIALKLVSPIIWAVALITGGIGYLGIQIGIPEYVLLYSWSAILIGYTYYRIKKDA